MAKFLTKKGSKGQGKNQNSKTAPLHRIVLKSKVRSWTDAAGSFMLTGDKHPTEYFTTKNLKGEYTAETSNFVKDPAMGTNLAANNICQSIDLMKERDLFKKVIDLLPEDLGDHLQMLDVQRCSCDDEEGMKKAAQAVFKFFGDKDASKKKMKAFADAANVALAIYGSCMTCIEMTYNLCNIKAMASEVPNKSSKPKAIRKFCEKPNVESLAKAVASELWDRINAEKNKGNRKLRNVGDDSGDDTKESSDVSPSSVEKSRSSSSSDEKNKKQKKDKKNKKKRKTSSSNSSGNKKKAKKVKGAKAKKDKDTKKRKASTCSSSSNQSDDEPKKATKDNEKAKGPKKKKEDEQKNGEKKDADELELSFLSWNQGSVQEQGAALAQFVEEYNISKSHEDLQAIFAAVPDDVVSAAGLETFRIQVLAMAELPEKERIAKKLEAFGAVLSKAEKFFDQQSGAGAKSSGSG